MNRFFGGPDKPEEDEEQPVLRPMQPLDRSRPRTSYPPQAIPLRAEDDEPAEIGEEDVWSEEPDEEEPPKPRASRQDLDPVFGYVMAMALSVGLTPIDGDTRYILLWAFLALMGGTAFVLGSGTRKATDPGDLIWGLALGGLSGGALMLVGGDTLAVTSERLFGASRQDNTLLITWVAQATLFVMPLAETLFFRGAMQRVHSFLTVSLLASLWSVLLFFPELDLGGSPAVAVVYGAVLVLLNFLYGYVNFRHGLAASLICQVTAGSLLLLAPMILTG
ncbi:MAG TPA: hypothetical protein PKD09_06270 [Aggregatilinea sp.]|uniref:hypothetical protein n=1 Tax=Aggregatilinea sp. TaxID=2806333 RepID=UPI002C00C02C|nr:hypothetical protein [Aggregatilinea sp.]HML21231.1 hypothetical protein [Aggregatilinea sp.]